MSDGETGGPGVDELLSILGNETRMGILRTLWEEFDFQRYVTDSAEGTPYSALLEAADTDDSGNFNYHLRQLNGVLVADEGDGYALTPLGYSLMRALGRYETFDHERIEERVVDEPCPYCGGDLAAEYDREIVSVRCRDCDCVASGGNFTFVEVPATSESMPLPDLLDAAVLSMLERIRSAGQGVCWDCRSTVECSVEVCPDHGADPDGGEVCPECDVRYPAYVGAVCGNCGAEGYGPPLDYAAVTPAVGAFFDRFDRGPTTAGPWRYRVATHAAASERVVSTDPAVTEVTFELDGATCTATVTEPADGRGLGVDVDLPAGVPAASD